MIPESITIDGKSGTVVYLDAKWHPVPAEQATMARVLFDDGSSAFFLTGQDLVEKYDPNQLRDEKGRWAKGSGHLGTTFLHGTVQGLLDDIIANGLRGSMGGLMHPTDRRNRTLALPGHVYMTTDEREARAYAQIAGVSEGDARKKGITIPKPSIQDVVYDPEGFPLYRSGTEIGGTMPVVLTIELPRSEAAKLRKDRRSDLLMSEHFGGPNPDKKKSEVARSYKGDIKPEWITSIAYLTSDIATGVETWHTINPKEWKTPQPTEPPPWEKEGKPPPWQQHLKAAADTVTLYVPFAIQLQSTEGLGGITRKFDEAKHPRGDDGRFIEATQPRIFRRPSDVGEVKGWPGDPVRFGWKEQGEVTGRLLTGEPIPRDQIPAKLYHVTTNAPAVESSGVLLGLLESGGLGGGQEEGVSFTSSKEDAVVIQRELRRAVLIARGDVDFDVFEAWARQDELMAGLPEGALSSAVKYQRDFVEGNLHSIQGAWVSDPTGEYADENRGKTFGHIGPLAPEERERLRRSLLKDALNSYLQMRESAAEEARGQKVPILKNPLLFGRQEQLAKLDPKNIQILEAAAEDIPAEALVTTGSDKFLHEVRVYADVPRRRKKVAFDESKVQREPAGTSEGGQFAETGRTGSASDPVLATQAKTGIAAIEKLLPTAIKTADYRGELAADTWSDLSEAVQNDVEREYKEHEYENVDPDESELRREARSELQDDNQAILDEAVKDTLTSLENKFPDTEAALPLGEGQFSLMRTLDPDTFDYVDGTDDGGPIALDLDALRFKTGQELTDTQKRQVQEMWNLRYRESFDAALETKFESDEYLEKVSELREEQIRENWNSLSDQEKLNLVSEFDIRIQAEHKEPREWTTGIDPESQQDEDYVRTHAIALKLTELRTDEIRKERGLLTHERPKYLIQETEEAFLVRRAEDGFILWHAPTEEDAKLQGELWADRQEKKPATPSSELITNVWSAWKTSSSSGLGLALQLAAAKELGGVHRMTPEEEARALEIAKAHGGIETLQAYVRAQWETTQFVMQRAGEDKLMVYRAVMLPGAQVGATTTKIVDKLGGPIPSATDIVEHASVGLSAGYVSFDFDGETLRETKKRVSEPPDWEDKDPAIRTVVRQQWDIESSQIAKELGRDEEASQKKLDEVWNSFPSYVKSEILTSYRAQGKIPNLPWESTEQTIQRRIAEYTVTSGADVYVKLPDLQLKRAGAQSTTSAASVANDWGGVGNLPPDPVRVVIRLETPATSVLSIPVYGENVQEEHETVVVGTRDRWAWDAWRRQAPEFGSQSIMDTSKKAETTPLVVDLQAEDRGKPHWMTGVDWSKVLKWDEAQHPREAKGGPEGGQFTRVAMTSQRTAGDPGHQSNQEVFRHMGEFHDRLKALPGVSNVSVKPGVGGWEGGSESMWQIYYKGNGEARKLVARTAKAFNQDAVLILNACKGEDCQPAVELSFGGAVSPTARDQVHRVLVANGIGGWTWMKRDGKTVLRMVCVPQWGGEAAKHQQATAAVSQQLRTNGLKNHRRVHQVAVSVMEREGAHSYDAIIGA